MTPPISRVQQLLERYIQASLADDAAGQQAVLDEAGSDLAALEERIRWMSKIGGVDAAPRVPEGPLAFPEAFDGFRLGGVLGRGGAGTVYAATQLEPHRQVAIKFLHPHASTSARTRFVREAQALARLDHPNIVRVLASGAADGHPYYAMEFVQGVELPAGDGAVGLEEQRAMARLGSALADALEHCHQVGIVHRDITPRNVLVRPDQTPVLVDFGLAVDESASVLTRSGDFVGTLGFAAPEQTLGRTTDARVDVFGLAGVLCFGLAGSTPFTADGWSEYLDQVHAEPRPVRRLMPECHRDLANVLDRAMAPAREDRYATAGDFARDLLAFAEGRPVMARGRPWIARTWAAVRRRAAVLLAAALLLTLALVGGNMLAGHIHATALAEQQQLDDQSYAGLSFLWSGAHSEAVDVGRALSASHPDAPEGWLLHAIGEALRSDRGGGRAVLDGAPIAVRARPSVEYLASLWGEGAGDLGVKRPDAEDWRAAARIASIDIFARRDPDAALAVLEPFVDAEVGPEAVRLPFLQAQALARKGDAASLVEALLAASRVDALLDAQDAPLTKFFAFRVARSISSEIDPGLTEAAVRAFESFIESTPQASTLKAQLAYAFTEGKPDGWIERARALYEEVLASGELPRAAAATVRHNLANLLFERTDAQARAAELYASVEGENDYAQRPAYWMARSIALDRSGQERAAWSCHLRALERRDDADLVPMFDFVFARLFAAEPTELVVDELTELGEAAVAALLRRTDLAVADQQRLLVPFCDAWSNPRLRWEHAELLVGWTRRVGPTLARQRSGDAGAVAEWQVQLVKLIVSLRLHLAQRRDDGVLAALESEMAGQLPPLLRLFDQK